MRAVRTIGCSSLCHPGSHRQGFLSPAVQSMTVRSTPSQSRLSSFPTTSNRTGEFDMRNPFIPSRSTICRLADTALIFGVAAAGLVAVIAATLRQMGAL